MSIEVVIVVASALVVILVVALFRPTGPVKAHVRDIYFGLGPVARPRIVILTAPISKCKSIAYMSGASNSIPESTSDLQRRQSRG